MSDSVYNKAHIWSMYTLLHPNTFLGAHMTRRFAFTIGRSVDEYICLFYPIGTNHIGHFDQTLWLVAKLETDLNHLQIEETPMRRSSNTYMHLNWRAYIAYSDSDSRMTKWLTSKYSRVFWLRIPTYSSSVPYYTPKLKISNWSHPLHKRALYILLFNGYRNTRE